MTRRVLITGARRGIGLDVADRLAARGHMVYATVHRAESVAPTREALRQHADLVRVARLDLLNESDLALAAAWDVDVLINNAAVSESGPLLEMDLGRVQHVFQTNVLGTLALTQAVVLQMLARNERDARVIIVGSIMGVIPTPYRAPYGMSKWALENLALSLREELKPFEIPVIMITPGAYVTGFNRESAVAGWTQMSAESLYREHAALIHKEEAKVERVEVQTTESIAEQIVAAVEESWPRDRYVAPLWQWVARPRV